MIFRVCASLILFLGVRPVFASGTVAWSREGIDFKNGTLEGMMISPEGALVPRPEAQVLDRPEAPLIWDLVLEKDGLWAAGGVGGGLTRFGFDGKKESVTGWPGDPEVFAVARGSRGDLFAASGPAGAVYRVDTAQRRAQEIYRPAATYIWDLLVLPTGELVVATGLPGKVLKVDPAHPERPAITLWETKDPHVRSLALGRDGKLLAGTSGSGWVVQLDGKGGAFVLWDADRPEVVAMTVDGRGTIWAAVSGAPAQVGGPPAPPRKPEGSSSAAASAVVKMRAEETAEGAKEKEEGRGEPGRQTEPVGGGGEVLRLPSGRAAESLWSDKQETPLTLISYGEDGVLLGTAFPARIWWVDGKGRAGLMDERREARAVSVLSADGNRVVAAESNPAGLILYGPGLSASASWTSEVIDAKKYSTLGRIRVFSEAPAAPQIKVEVRGGNTADPGPEWSPWTMVPGAAGSPDGQGNRIDLPRARFFQCRVTGTPGPARVAVSFVELRYRPENLPPRLDSFDALPAGVAFRSLPPTALSSGDVPVVPPPRGPEAGELVGETRPVWRSKKTYEQGARTLVWQAKDPDDDPLRFAVDYCLDRGVPCDTWTPLAERLEQNFFSFDSRNLPDGVYRFRLTADDELTNPLGEGLNVVEISSPVAIDNTPPQISQWNVVPLGGGKIQLRVTVNDPGGRLAGAQVQLEPGRMAELAPEDGVNDGSTETYMATLGPLTPGWLVVVQAVDASGNTVTAQRPSP